jgi:hypothetical protein
VDFEIMGMEKTLSEQAPDIQTAFNLAKEKACLSLQNEKLQKDLNSARAAADNDSGSGLALGLALGMALS